MFFRETRIKVSHTFLFVSSFVLLVIIQCLISALLCPTSVSAYTTSISTSDSVVVNLKPDDMSSDLSSISTGTVTAATNCPYGYDLFIKGSVNSTNLYLDGNSSNSGSNYTVISPVSGTFSSPSALTTNTWGYSTADDATISSNFAGLTSTDVAIDTNSTRSTARNITFGVKVQSSTRPGAYKMIEDSSHNNGSIVYTMASNPSCMTYNLVYDKNDTTTNPATGDMSSATHTNITAGSSSVQTLRAYNFKRPGYGFLGWSLDKDAGTKVGTANATRIYGPMEDITVDDDFIAEAESRNAIESNPSGANDIKLYAIWLASSGSIQGWTGCENSNFVTPVYNATTGALTSNSVIALTDQRDNNVYTVAKLADGKCWMVENLRLDGTNSDNATGNLAQGYKSYSGNGTNYGNFIGLPNNENNNFINTNYANSIYYSDAQSGTTASMNMNTTNTPSQRMPRINTNNTNSNLTPLYDGTGSSTYYSWYGYGNYYTWAAAIANTTYYSSATATDADGKTSETAGTSICPAGWRLPYGRNTGNGNTAGGFYYLGSQLGATASSAASSKIWRSYPNNFIYSGSFSTSSASNRGILGQYWSSISSSSGIIATFRVGEGILSPGTGGDYKYTGLSIRCTIGSSEQFTLNYNGNGGNDTVTNVPASQGPVTGNQKVDFAIPSTVPVRSGYTFNGWIDEAGAEVAAGETYTANSHKTGANITLYARWTRNECNTNATTIGTGNSNTDAVCLQDMNLAIKASMPVANASSGTYTLIDSRDGKQYTVAKLADGNVWMTQNLNFGNSTNTLLTSSDTDLSNDTTFLAPASSNAYDSSSYTTPLIQSDVTVSSYTINGVTYSPTNAYYTYAAAIANNNTITSGSILPTSICPKGWDLPSDQQYLSLRSAGSITSSSIAVASPYNFIYGGYKTGTTSFYGETAYGYLWASRNSSSSYSFRTYVSSNGLQSGSQTGYKYYASSIRCIVGNGAATVHYDANGGTGTMASQTNVEINTENVKVNSFTAPANRQFRNWNTKADGTGTTVTASTPLSSIASDGDIITLYAQWNELYYIAFNANESSVGATSGSATGTMTNQTVINDTATAIKTSTFALTGYIFLGWNTKADGTGTFYGDGQKVTNLTTTGNTITLYAV